MSTFCQIEQPWRVEQDGKLRIRKWLVYTGICILECALSIQVGPSFKMVVKTTTLFISQLELTLTASCILNDSFGQLQPPKTLQVYLKSSEGGLGEGDQPFL